MELQLSQSKWNTRKLRWTKENKGFFVVLWVLEVILSVYVVVPDFFVDEIKVIVVGDNRVHELNVREHSKVDHPVGWKESN